MNNTDNPIDKLPYIFHCFSKVEPKKILDKKAISKYSDTSVFYCKKFYKPISIFSI